MVGGGVGDSDGVGGDIAGSVAVVVLGGVGGSVAVGSAVVVLGGVGDCGGLGGSVAVGNAVVGGDGGCVVAVVLWRWCSS